MSMSETPRKINLEKQGLEAFFGELEAKIMRVLWEGRSCSINDVKKTLDAERNYSYNTVMTVLNRLAEKGVIRKRKKGNTTWYAPVQGRDEFLKSTAKAMLSVVFGRKAAIPPAAFAEALEGLPEKDLKVLKGLLK